MERREFLGVTAAGAISLILPGRMWWAEGAMTARALARTELLNILGDPALVREIGRLYRASHPDEDDPQVLETIILADAEASAPVSQAQLGRQVRGDFSAGRTVVVKGWVLSLTEARQCALFSLLYS